MYIVQNAQTRCIIQFAASRLSVNLALTCEILCELLLELGVAFALLLRRIETEVGHELPANERTTRELAFKTSRAQDTVDAPTKEAAATHMIISGAIALM